MCVCVSVCLCVCLSVRVPKSAILINLINMWLLLSYKSIFQEPCGGFALQLLQQFTLQSVLPYVPPPPFHPLPPAPLSLLFFCFFVFFGCLSSCVPHSQFLWLQFSAFLVAQFNKPSCRSILNYALQFRSSVRYCFKQNMNFSKHVAGLRSALFLCCCCCCCCCFFVVVAPAL